MLLGISPNPSPPIALCVFLPSPAPPRPASVARAGRAERMWGEGKVLYINHNDKTTSWARSDPPLAQPSDPPAGDLPPSGTESYDASPTATSLSMAVATPAVVGDVSKTQGVKTTTRGSLGDSEAFESVDGAATEAMAIGVPMGEEQPTRRLGFDGRPLSEGARTIVHGGMFPVFFFFC